MDYIVEVQEHGRVISIERVGSDAAAKLIADPWRRNGYHVVVKTETNGSTPLGGPPLR